MKIPEKSKALLELGRSSLEAIGLAHKQHIGFVLSAVICSIRISYEVQAKLIMASSEAPKYSGGGNTKPYYQMTQRPVEIITINTDSQICICEVHSGTFAEPTRCIKCSGKLPPKEK